MDIFEKRSILSRFDELASHVWGTQDMGSPEYRELAQLAPSDWACLVPAQHQYSARHNIEAARKALVYRLGIDS